MRWWKHKWLQTHFAVDLFSATLSQPVQIGAPQIQQMPALPFPQPPTAGPLLWPPPIVAIPIPQNLVGFIFFVLPCCCCMLSNLIPLRKSHGTLITVQKRRDKGRTKPDLIFFVRCFGNVQVSNFPLPYFYFCGCSICVCRTWTIVWARRLLFWCLLQ